MTAIETHEPVEPIDWPNGHVQVAAAPRLAGSEHSLSDADINVALTAEDANECILITIGEARHYLHSTTARALSDKLLAFNGPPVMITIHGITHTTGGATARASNTSLRARLVEWNRNAVAKGVLPV
ncbi:hypothetical protein [Agromyces larvae]|uniref:Uncharacterized protein n=1 Tax=Agromyces larvae TaxID=2929802 RepID=A0ABY4BVH2_9MICO|nr:hypothetical protein [Agromyces larvae]UOE43173.1 hypothetical protein MTO99_13380 [Agromyces larvae]